MLAKGSRSSSRIAILALGFYAVEFLVYAQLLFLGDRVANSMQLGLVLLALATNRSYHIYHCIIMFKRGFPNKPPKFHKIALNPRSRRYSPLTVSLSRSWSSRH